MNVSVAAAQQAAYRARPMITGAQIRAARGLLGWTSQQLADASGVHYATISRAEQVDDIPGIRATSLAAIQRAFERAGIEFFDGSYSGTGGPGVRLRSA